MLANKGDKNLPRENTRLNFIISLQSPLLPALLSLQGALRPFGEAVSAQAVKVSVQSFLFAVLCSPVVPYAPQDAAPLRDEAALVWVYPQPTQSLWGHSCCSMGSPSIHSPFGVCMPYHGATAPLSHCLFLCSLFPLFFCPVLDMFSQRCHKLLQTAWLWPLVCLLQGLAQGSP